MWLPFANRLQMYVDVRGEISQDSKNEKSIQLLSEFLEIENLKFNLLTLDIPIHSSIRVGNPAAQFRLKH